MFISRFVKPPEYQKVKREGREYIEELRDPFIPNKQHKQVKKEAMQTKSVIFHQKSLFISPMC